MTATELRHLPGRPSNCARCRRRIIFAVTVARESGPGGKAMPLDDVEAADGNVAVRVGHGGRLLARVLKKGETHDAFTELLAMPHFATCPGAPEKPNARLPDDVADLAAHRERRRRADGGRP